VQKRKVPLRGRLGKRVGDETSPREESLMLASDDGWKSLNGCGGKDLADGQGGVFSAQMRGYCWTYHKRGDAAAWLEGDKFGPEGWPFVGS